MGVGRAWRIAERGLHLKHGRDMCQTNPLVQAHSKGGMKSISCSWVRECVFALTFECQVLEYSPASNPYEGTFPDKGAEFPPTASAKQILANAGRQERVQVSHSLLFPFFLRVLRTITRQQ